METEAKAPTQKLTVRCQFCNTWNRIDATPSLKEFKNKLQMKSELLSDFKRDISRAYGVLNEDRFYSNRAYFLIDKEGIVQWCHVETNNGQRRENSEILAAVIRLGQNPTS